MPFCPNRLHRFLLRFCCIALSWHPCLLLVALAIRLLTFLLSFAPLSLEHCLDIAIAHTQYSVVVEHWLTHPVAASTVSIHILDLLHCPQ